MAPYGAALLVVLLAVVGPGAPAVARAPSCVCTPSECEEVADWECPGGGVVWDACGCCRVCARVEDEPCGGPEGFHGACAPGLHCVLDPSQLLLPPRARRAGEARGTCKRVPGVQVDPSDGPSGVACPPGASSVFGCDIVGRVCRCSRVTGCSVETSGREGRKQELSGVGGGAGRRRRRRRWSIGELRGRVGAYLFTFSTLEECEMNLAEVLRQEELTPPSSGRDGSPMGTNRNCTSGCGGGDPARSPGPCPEGSARPDGVLGPCACRPSLCASAYLPFSCPFGARVLRRASRTPGDCCDLYECVPPPQGV